MITNPTDYVKIIEPCISLMMKRSRRYGDSVSIVKNSTLIDLVLMKLIRTRELDEKDEKYYDEVIDSINYLVFLLERRK